MLFPTEWHPLSRSWQPLFPSPTPIFDLPLDLSFEAGLRGLALDRCGGEQGGEISVHLPGVTKTGSEQPATAWLLNHLSRKKNPLKLSNCHLKVILRNVCLSITEETSTTKTISHINSLPGVSGLFLNYIPFKRNSQRLPEPFFYRTLTSRSP